MNPLTSSYEPIFIAFYISGYREPAAVPAVCTAAAGSPGERGTAALHPGTAGVAAEGAAPAAVGAVTTAAGTAAGGRASGGGQ